MNLPQRIRYLSREAYTNRTRSYGDPPYLDMRPFLAVPLPERLCLLALYDSKTMLEIKEALPWVKETDVRLTSHRILAALDVLQEAMKDPNCWMNPGPYPDAEPDDLTLPATKSPLKSRSIPEDIETQLRQALWPEVSILLFGDQVSARVGEMSLQHRAIVYLVVVEELSWVETQQLMNCSKRQIYTSLTEMVEALGG